MNRAVTDRDTIEAVEREESIKPLVSYLRQDRPFTAELRTWLLSLLEEDRVKSGNWFRLRLGKRKGSGSSHDKRQEHAKICDRVKQLTGEPITSDLCRHYARLIGHRVDSVVVGGRVTLRIMRSAEAKHKRLLKGKPISKTLACHIAAAEHGVSYGGVRKILRESAKR